MPVSARTEAAKKYTPRKTRVLFIAEAPPDNENRYFYFEKVESEDWLWLGLMKALFPGEFGQTSIERQRKPYWLAKFREIGCQLIDAIKEPLISSEDNSIAAIEKNIPFLIVEIQAISPDQIVLVKSTVHEALHKPLRIAEFKVVNDAPLPFPSTGHQTEFHTGIRQLIAAGTLRVSRVVAGVDGCQAGWAAFKIELPSLRTSVEVVDLGAILTKHTGDLSYVAIDIPIGLPDRPRVCDIAARKLLGWPRRNSVFPPPCRAALAGKSYTDASAINCRTTQRHLTKQAWCIASKIKEVDDAITPECQEWAAEVHPEICFWALAGRRPMVHRKTIGTGVQERLDLLRPVFPEIDHHLINRPQGVGKDDLLDAAVAAWTALRLCMGEAHQVCDPESDSRGLEAVIWY